MHVNITVNPTYNATKSDVTYAVTSSGAWAAGTLTNTNNFSGKDLTLNGYQRNWDNSNFANQTLWTGNSLQQVLRQSFTLLPANNFAAVSQLNFAGTLANGTVECDMLLDNALGKMGLTWRTTSLIILMAAYAYSAEIAYQISRC